MLQGIDVSTWQGEMDWQKASDAGAKFAFIRAGSCTSDTGFCYTDYEFIRNATFAPELMPVGYYWYFRPQHQPLNQADYFSNLVNQEDWLIPPVADIENDGGLSPAAYADAIKAFLDRVESLTTIRPLIYTSNSKWSQVEPRSYWPTYDLWVAHYTASPEPLLPEAWASWRFWQHTSAGDGDIYGADSAYIDLNWFYGDENDLHEYLNIKPVVPLIVEVISWRNSVLHDEPGEKRISVANKGLRFAVVGSQEDDNGKLWYDVGGLWLPATNVKEVPS
jgi:lysozyme